MLRAKMQLTQVPTESEIKELLKGKSPFEKKMLLKEIEKARQQRIHLEYLLEQQQLRNDEKWAMRNVEERQAVLSLYDNESHRSGILNRSQIGSRDTNILNSPNRLQNDSNRDPDQTSQPRGQNNMQDSNRFASDDDPKVGEAVDKRSSLDNVSFPPIPGANPDN